ncbi:winged helix-turn-helix transcriptional regulator [Nocardia sp. GCM10030253]|uniref:winged helix-turn-helix transcriptional regulator n=1 Tax=Nocardia sp. GCM10030253 TaxID=3273404 RepID=UPI00362C59EF
MWERDGHQVAGAREAGVDDVPDPGRSRGGDHRVVPGQHHVVFRVSQRMLTLTTKRLWRDGIIERIAYPTIPPQVEYRLTTTGRSLAETILVLAGWSREHKGVIAAARQQWDAEHASANQA